MPRRIPMSDTEIYKGLEALQAEAGRIAREHQFTLDDDFPDLGSYPLDIQRRILTYYTSTKLMLVAGEAAEAQEEIRAGGTLAEIYYKDSDGNRTDDPGSSEVPNKPEGFVSELADIVIRVMSLADERHLPLTDVVLKKMRFNDTRPVRHNKEF